jgi:hypothetical protein
VRRPYLPPVGVFLLVNGAYFVYTGVTGQHVFDTPLRTHLAQTAHSGVARRLVERRLAARHQTLAEYAPRFDRVAQTQAKTLIVAMVPGLALAAAAVGLRRGRGALHHVTFAFHAMSVLLASLMAVTAAVLYPLAYAARAVGWGRVLDVGDGLAALILTLPFAGWLVLALRRAYGDGWAGAAVKTVVLLAALLWVLFAYGHCCSSPRSGRRDAGPGRVARPRLLQPVRTASAARPSTAARRHSRRPPPAACTRSAGTPGSWPRARGRALQEAVLHEERLVHLLDRAAVLAHRRGDGRDPHRPAVELLDDGAQHARVHVVEPELVDVQPPERQVGHLAVDHAVPLDLRVVAHAAQQAVGDARRAARAPRDLARAVHVARHLEHLEVRRTISSSASSGSS